MGVRAQDLPVPCALGLTVVPDARGDSGQRGDAGPQMRTPAVVFETGQRGQAESRVDVAAQFADGPGLAAVGVQVEQPEAGAFRALCEERVPEELVAGADREDRGALVDRPVQAAVGDQALRGQGLRAVLAAADQVDVGHGRHRLVRADLVRLDRNAADRRPPAENEQIAPVAIGREQVWIDPDDAQRALS